MEPLSRRERLYRWLCLYSVDLSDVQHSLRVLRRYRRKDVRWCILRELLVAYARPFSKNEDGKGHSHRLEESMVPPSLREVHAHVMRLRNQFIAHTDFAPYNPQTRKNEDRVVSVGRGVRMVFFAPAYGAVEAQLPEISKLVSAVEEAIERRIATLEEKRQTRAARAQLRSGSEHV